MEEGRQTHWIPLADLMTGLMMIFLLIVVLSLSKVNRTTTVVVQEYVKTQEDLKQALREEFDKNLKEWDAELLGDMTIKFNNPDALFATGSSALSSKFKTILQDFLPRYVAILQKEKFKSYINEIKIEGHTSSAWGNVEIDSSGGDDSYQRLSPKQKSYINNLNLSQQRAKSVIQFSLTIPSLQSKESWIREKLTANGLSSSRPVVKNGIVLGAQAQRRVEFKVVLRSDEILQSINQMEQARIKNNSGQ